MGWFSRFTVTRSAEAAARDREWEAALERDTLPAQVEKRLRDAGAGRTPWVASMTPAELLIAKSHGCRPIATVSGTCWYSFGRSWTEGHAEGWSRALNRIGEEAYACGANAVVDVQLRRIQHGFGSGMDFTLIGTAVKIDGLKPSARPVIATVPALEFVRLLEMGIVPVGLAIGARYEWLGGFGTWNGWGSAASRTQWQLNALSPSQPLGDLSDFWERIRREAIWDLRDHAAAQGNGVLAHTHFSQLIRQERDKAPPAYLGRYIVLGTVVDTPANAPVPHHIRRVADMRDPSPLDGTFGRRNDVYSGEMGEGEGAI
ncbi:uncharacterized protein YbjQ (UPF0145 family) [Sphingomonas vulcanisoli]|uniref:Uncharacterized protein YbjQ (UPF0145 family) n=1 Tax=Sphingomonas vulcanisoli TaxID=1658060 RepID=A0ABX0TXD2_9SPHN|nr:heavy metal-binding domain-containing protein [Sphingomonas vulcanisoli]NIJ08824.1 uncharacterized protein YbjQ (UPF0145 family) [Sphingomonas vulcanisoli]